MTQMMTKAAGSSGRGESGEFGPTERLTPREAEVLALAAEGLTSRQVADKLFISKRTVDFHLDGIYAKFEVRNRMQAILEAERRGYLSPPA